MTNTIGLKTVISPEVYNELVDETVRLASEKYTEMARTVADFAGYNGRVEATADVELIYDKVDHAVITDVTVGLDFPDVTPYDIMGQAQSDIVRMLFSELMNKSQG